MRERYWVAQEERLELFQRMEEMAQEECVESVLLDEKNPLVQNVYQEEVRGGPTKKMY